MEYKKVTGITVDWFYDTQNGEQFSTYTVGKNGVTAIHYHTPQGEGDKHFCDIELEDGVEIRAFNINTIFFK